MLRLQYKQCNKLNCSLCLFERNMIINIIPTETVTQNTVLDSRVAHVLREGRYDKFIAPQCYKPRCLSGQKPKPLSLCTMLNFSMVCMQVNQQQIMSQVLFTEFSSSLIFLLTSYKLYLLSRTGSLVVCFGHIGSPAQVTESNSLGVAFCSTQKKTSMCPSVCK
jgi:hypothetical protein